MAINNRFESKSSTEQRTSKGGMTVSKMHSTETRTEKSTSNVYQVDQDSIEAAFRERIYEVDRMVTEADFQRQLPSQTASTSECRVLMTTGCNILRACGSTAERSDSASALELGKYNHL